MPSGKISLNQFAGLVTAPGLLQRNPASCITAMNWEFPAPGVVRKRRGFSRQTGTAGGPVWKLLTSRLMGSNVLAHIGTTTKGIQLRYGDGSAALTAAVTVDGEDLTRTPDTVATPGVRMQAAVCQRNHYLTADEAVARLESDFQTSNIVRYAGMPRGQCNGTHYTGGLVAGTTFADGKARAYRLTWHRKDADGVELGGAPTSRCVIANAVYNTTYTAGSRDFVIAVQIPNEFGTQSTALTTAYYWRLWGTRQYAEATELGDDEMHLLTEQYLTAGDLINGYVTFTDSTPDSFLLSSPSLHTNLYNFPASEVGLKQGIVNEDAPPPAANDVAYWMDVLWYADLWTRPSITVGLVSALADGDTVTVTSNATTTVLTAKLVPVAVNQFKICTTAATNAINLRETVNNMVYAMNRWGNVAGFTAHGITTNSTQPGLCFLELVRMGAARTQPLVFTSSAATKWSGFDGYKIQADVFSVEQPNMLRFSKPLRGDALPPINFLSVGNADSRIMRIIPFRDRLIVFTDSGIYQVTGRTFADFSVFPFDLGYRLMGPELVAMCDEKLYAWCNEGIIEIDDGGVRVVSAPIEPTIEAALVACGTATTGAGTVLYKGRGAFSILGFATAYRNQHQVRFHYPEAYVPASMSQCAYWLSFDTRTRTWAQGTSKATIGGYIDGPSCGVVRYQDDLLMRGSWSAGADTYLFLERRAYAAADYTDTARDGTDTAITSTLTMQYQIPDEEGAQHWQQTVFNWDTGEISWRNKPTSIAVTHGTESVNGSPQTVAVAASSTRVETADDARRAQRLAVTLTHDAFEYCGFIGISQAYRQGTRFAREVTP